MAQEFPVAGGFGQIAAGVFIPDIWSTNLLARYYEEALVPFIVNLDYEGEIKNQGDKVIIRRDPETTIFRYYAGMVLPRQVVIDESEELTIDYGAAYNIPIEDVQKWQSDIEWVSRLEANATRQHKRYVDQQVLGNIYSDAATATTLGNMTLNANNLPQFIVDARVALRKTFTPDDQKWWMVVPYWLEGLFLLNPTFISAHDMGDTESMIRAGLIGTLGNFMIYGSPNLATVSTWEQVIFGCKTAVTFGTQFVKNEQVPNPDSFGFLIRGLQVFGWKTVQSGHLGKRGVKQGS